jgi:hypothetical protein
VCNVRGDRDDATAGATRRDDVLRAWLARTPEMTAEERGRQRESFARGNVRVDEP